MQPLRFGIKTSQAGSSYQAILPCWLEADRLGFDTAWLYDHFVPGEHPAGTACGEGWTLLSALLARTERLRGGLMVTGNTHRHPILLANIASTVDHISNGRMEFGFGTGWSIPEHMMFGWDLPPIGERIRRFDEACRIIKSLWTEPETTFSGEHYQLRAARLDPKPIQKPYPHFVIGAAGEKVMMRKAAEHADEWNWVGGPVETYRAKVEAMEQHLRTVGRDPASLQRSVQMRVPEGAATAELAALASEFVKLGVDHLIFSLSRPHQASQVTWLWEEAVPAIRDVVGR